jgi:hypothetical protein
MKTEQFQKILNRIEAGEFDISVLCFGEKGGKNPSVVKGVDEDKLKSTLSEVGYSYQEFVSWLDRMKGSGRFFEKYQDEDIVFSNSGIWDEVASKVEYMGSFKDTRYKGVEIDIRVDSEGNPTGIVYIGVPVEETTSIKSNLNYRIDYDDVFTGNKLYISLKDEIPNSPKEVKDLVDRAIGSLEINIKVE